MHHHGRETLLKQQQTEALREIMRRAEVSRRLLSSYKSSESTSSSRRCNVIERVNVEAGLVLASARSVIRSGDLQYEKHSWDDLLFGGSSEGASFVLPTLSHNAAGLCGHNVSHHQAGLRHIGT